MIYFSQTEIVGRKKQISDNYANVFIILITKIKNKSILQILFLVIGIIIVYSSKFLLKVYYTLRKSQHLKGFDGIFTHTL